MVKKVDEIINIFLKDLDSDIVCKLFANISSGKKLRAKLILKIAGESDQALALAAIVEMIQVASLLHDDVIDDSNTRRGQKSINAIFGNKTAIMLGDILYSKAYYELNSISKEVAKVISNGVTELSIGELLDVELSKNFNTSKELYFEMIYKKTASLIQASAKSAAIISKKDKKSFSLYGKNLGIAFQIIDDILDITSDSKTLGKPALHDFKEGKTTLPYILLYEKLSNNDKLKLKKLFKKDLNDNEKTWLLSEMKKNGAIEESLKIAKELAFEAKESIKKYKNKDLENIINDMIQRSY